MGNKVFNVAVFFVVLREALEAVIVVSVLLSFVKQAIGSNDPKLYSKLKKQIWLGAIAGFIICLIIGAGFIGAYYGLQKDVFGNTEDLWEGVFCLIATIMISFMGLAMLRLNKMQAKWRVKIAKSIVQTPKYDENGKKKAWQGFGYIMKKYCMFILPFVTVLREGLEAVVFVAGAGVTTTDSKASSFPLPVVCGLLCGLLVGAFIFYGGSHSSLQIFLVISTCILYLISAGLFSRAAWFFENYRYNKKTGGDASENGSGPGSYNVAAHVVYHINFANPEIDNGWDVFNSLLGWQNTGYLSNILCYNLYWVVIITVVLLMLYEEKHGHLPFLKNRKLKELSPFYWVKSKYKKEITKQDEKEIFDKLQKVAFDSEGNLVAAEEKVVEVK
ncbi:high-affinity iron permease [Hanseniaspora opuntiae]|uniref:Plasma membrane iron permease n=1 Tax=Hanseniaspora opuntiae TaxID=211096 RepID=A0A1E5RKE2_9ASCO|nr:Plasma membrane iron permease [Hanseniaspora opuntiae]